MYQKIVWILGAGFSRPLGGPLLPDLLSQQSWSKVTSAYPQRNWAANDPEQLVLSLYEAHRRRGDRFVGTGRWSDAEEFLSFLDSAASGHRPSRAEFEQLAEAFTSRFNDPGAASSAASAAARRMIAAECGAFLVDAHVDGEDWLPYRSWAASLSPEWSTVVTFNYDLVIEQLARKFTSKFDIVEPSAVVGVPHPKAVPVYKLHGSIDWLRVQAGDHAEIRVGRADDEFLKVDGSQLAIATPGRTKLAVTEELASLWAGAEKAIREADAIIFVGYRFPPSDPMAVERILGALTQNESLYLAIHAVLGSKVDDDHTARLRELVTGAMRAKGRRVTLPTQDLNRWERPGYNLVPHPLWAQDFIGRTVQGHLTQAFLHWSSR